MAGSQSFGKRVLMPLVVICLTVGGLSTMGLSLWHMNSSTSSSGTMTASINNPATSTVASNGYLPVQVFNDSNVPGLARKTARELEKQNWTVHGIANWSGASFKKSTVFYPAAGRDSAQALSTQLHVNIAPARASMSDSELTYVLVQK